MKVLLCLVMLIAPLCASQITIDGTMSLVWQYDLTTNQFNNVTMPVMPVHVVINESVPVGVTGSYNVGSVTITEPLYANSTALYNSTGILNEPSWQETWITLVDSYSNDFRWMEFNNGPLMTNPNNFTSAEFESILFTQVYAGASWGMRDDGNGLQNLLGGTITSVTISNQAPEPTTCVMMFLALACLWKRK